MFESLYTAYDHGFSELELPLNDNSNQEHESIHDPQYLTGDPPPSSSSVTAAATMDHTSPTLSRSLTESTSTSTINSLDDYQSPFFINTAGTESISSAGGTGASASESSVKNEFLETSPSPGAADWSGTFSTKHAMNSVDTLTSLTDVSIKCEDPEDSSFFDHSIKDEESHNPHAQHIFTTSPHEEITSTFVEDDSLMFTPVSEYAMGDRLNMRFSNFSTTSLPDTLVADALADNQSPELTTTFGGFPSSPVLLSYPPPMVRWVKLTPMTPHRIRSIHALAATKGIDADVVESVLNLYLNRDSSHDNHVTRFRDGDVHIKIIVGMNCTGPPLNEEEMARKKRNKRAQRDPNYVKRPLNSFMLYRRSQTQSAMAQAISSHLKLNHQNISQIIGLMWQTESQQLKDLFASFASQEKDLHKAMYPDYKFSPQKRRRSQILNR